MIVLEDNRLEFRFAEVHAAARCSIEFQRTLRIPDDSHDYPLPPGLGHLFRFANLDDYAARLSESWRVRGGVLAPMHQAEGDVDQLSRGLSLRREGGDRQDLRDHG